MNNPINIPLISIVTVVLNRKTTIENTIMSVINQNFDNYEYIIIDGNSTDGTVEIIEKYTSKLAFFISETDSGLYDAMNKAVSLARGKFILFLGADDTLLESLNKIATYLKDINTVYYGNVYRPKLGMTYDGKFYPYKLACRNICHQSVFYPRDILKNIPFNLNYKIFADYELNLQLFFVNKINFKYIPETVAVFMDEGGISQCKLDDQFEKRKLKILRSHAPPIIYYLLFVRYIFLSFAKKIGILHILVQLHHQFRKHSVSLLSRLKVKKLR